MKKKNWNKLYCMTSFTFFKVLKSNEYLKLNIKKIDKLSTVFFFFESTLISKKS